MSLAVYEYPTHISPVDHRVDIYTNSNVKRGLIFDLYSSNKTVTKQDFDRLLQCPMAQPDIDGKNGCFSLLKLMPLTQEIVEMMCVYAETNDGDWSRCKEKLYDFKNGSYPQGYRQNMNGFEGYSMFRIINNSIYGDWPWGVERLGKPGKGDTNFLLMQSVAGKISDLKDSVFFVGTLNITLHTTYMLLSYTIYDIYYILCI